MSLPPFSNASVQSKKIAIVGAGIAGLSCATDLIAQGHHVTVFEKSKGVAGRMSTKRLDDGHCDHGAQYFTCNHPEFEQQVQAWLQAQVVAEWKVQPRVLGGYRHHNSQLATTSLEGSNSAMPAHTPNPTRYVGVPGMTAPAKQLQQELQQSPQFQLLTSHTVVQLQKQWPSTPAQQLNSHAQPTTPQWRIGTQEQQDLTMSFDAVLLALPSTQALTLVQPHSESLAHVCQTPMSPCFALMVQYEKPFDWDLEAAFVNQGPLSWICKNNSKLHRQGPETWLLHSNPEWSSEHLEDDPCCIQTELLKAFHTWFVSNNNSPTVQALSTSELIPPIKSCILHRWKYANVTQHQPIAKGFVWDANLQMGLCGDWLNGGKVQGAWLSGLELGKAYNASSQCVPD